MPNLSPTVVQTQTGWVSSNIPGHDLGPGTRGMITLEVDFSASVTATNHILVGIAGMVPYNIAQGVTLAPILAFFFNIGGGSLPNRNYYVGVSYTDSLGRETAVQANLINVSANNVARLSQPNPNINVIPNAVTWNAYAGLTPTTMHLQQSGIAPSDFWQEANTGITNTGPLPPGKPVYDNISNTYSQFLWSDGGSGGAQLGEQALGLFYTALSRSGPCHIQIVLGCFNGNPIQDNLCDIDAIVVELTAPTVFPGASYVLVTNGVTKQGNTVGDLSVELDNTSVSVPVISDWGTTIQGSAGVVDMNQSVPGIVFDTFIAMYSSKQPGTLTPATPTRRFLAGNPAGAYTLVAQVQSDPVTAQGLIYYLWFPSPVSTPDLACPLSGIATLGVHYSGTLIVTGGSPPYTFSVVSGSLPPGLLLDASTGVISGTPLVAGPFPYTVQVMDSLGATGTASCLINVLPGPPAPPPCAGVVPQPSTDVQFELRRVYATLVPHKRIPVRGGSGN